MELDEIKTYIRVESDDEDSLIKMFQLEAEEYLEGAGITKGYNKNKYKLAILLLISDSYENREIRGAKNTKYDTISDRLSRIVLQLQLEEEAQQ